ncbi:hypothetical protein KBD18_00310 [Patescibacteria group bacterium]|nr:hypothetical protein [Patescibacteria group bacterium]
MRKILGRDVGTTLATKDFVAEAKRLLLESARAAILSGPDSDDARAAAQQTEAFIDQVFTDRDAALKRDLRTRFESTLGLPVTKKPVAPSGPSVAQAATKPVKKPRVAVKSIDALILRHMPNDAGDGSGISGTELINKLKQKPGHEATTTISLRGPIKRLVALKAIGHNGKPTNARRYFRLVTNPM